MPAGLGLPARAGWAWFYLYNEHIARFLGRRIPHDYGQVPIPLFWLLLLIWLFPWVAWVPAAVRNAVRDLRTSGPMSNPALRFDSDASFSHLACEPASRLQDRRREAALALLLWPGIILGFFTLSSRQEYYHLPALPALALLVGGLLARADAPAGAVTNQTPSAPDPERQVRRGSFWFLVPVGALLCVLCAYFAAAAPSPPAGATLNELLSSNPALYNLSLGHIFDLTGQAMGFFRGPLLTVALGMLALGPVSHLLRRTRALPRAQRNWAANLLVAGAMTAILLAAHEGLVRFYPTLGSKDLALAIDAKLKPADLIVIDGELTSGSTLLFYTPGIGDPKTGQHVLLVNGRRNGPWFGSFWPDAPHIFLDEAGLRQQWAGPRRVFLLTREPALRTADLRRFGPTLAFAASGGKTVLTNRDEKD